MNVISIFLDEQSMIATNGNYGIVSNFSSAQPQQQRFTEQYVNKRMLVEDLQNKLNFSAENLVSLPDDADRVQATTEWQVLKSILEEVKAL